MKYDVLIKQVELISEFIKKLDSMPASKRMSAVSQFTYQKRETEDKNFVYCGILSKGDGQWVLSGRPTSKQKEMKKLFGDSFHVTDPWLRYFIEFTNESTIIEFQLVQGRKENRKVDDLFVEYI